MVETSRTPSLTPNRRIPPFESRRDLTIAGWLLLTLVAFYLATSSGSAPYGDEATITGVTQSMLRGSLKPMDYRTGANGEVVAVQGQYAKYPLGQSLLELPGTLLMQRFKQQTFFQPLALNLLPVLECALMAALLYLLTRLPGRRGGNPLLSRRIAAALALATGVATQLWPSASTHFGDTSAAFLTFAAFFLVVCFCQTAAGPWTLILAAWAVALAYFCKNTYALVWPALALYGLWAVRRRLATDTPLAPARLLRILGLIALPLALAIIAQLWFNHRRYGSIWQAGYNGERDGSFGFGTPLLVGLYGILFSAGRSLFLYSPLCLLAFLGARRLARRRPAECLLAAGMTVPLLLIYVRWWAWYGGWEWGCRFYLFLVPFLMWLSAPAWGWLGGSHWPAWPFRVRAALLALLLGVSLYVQCLGVLIHPATPWAIMSQELGELQRPLCDGKFWEIRDDMPLNHFVPEFSPVAMDAWLVWATWNRTNMSEAALVQHAPMHSLNPHLVPEPIMPYLGYNMWVWGEWIQGSKPLVIGILLVLGLVGGFGLLRVVQLTRPSLLPACVPGAEPITPEKSDPNARKKRNRESHSHV